MHNKRSQTFLSFLVSPISRGFIPRLFQENMLIKLLLLFRWHRVVSIYYSITDSFFRVLVGQELMVNESIDHDMT